MELNAKMRSGLDMKTYKIVKKIEDTLMPLNKLLNGQKKPIYIYRCIKKPFDKKLQSGFTSTSNVPILGFGTYVYKVIIFPTTKVGFFDISQQVNKNQNGF